MTVMAIGSVPFSGILTRAGADNVVSQHGNHDYEFLLEVRRCKKRQFEVGVGKVDAVATTLISDALSQTVGINHDELVFVVTFPEGSVYGSRFFGEIGYR